MKSIVLIVPYFGEWPFWFSAFLKSCKKNSSIDWLFLTDCDTHVSKPDNVVFIQSTLEDIRHLAETKMDISIALTTPRKLCDLRPAYGHIFQEYISKYHYWGFCDVDVIWGDIRKFITEDILNKYDIISSRKENISGHFTILKNDPYVNRMYESFSNYKSNLQMERLMRMDEELFSDYLKHTGTKTFKVYWPKILLNQERGIDSHQEYYLDKWLWKDGKMLEIKDGEPVNEVMYLHFINWKRTMRHSEISYKDKIDEFYVSYNKIHYEKHSELHHFINEINNFFNGFRVIEKRRIRKYKLKSFKKRVVIKLNTIINGSNRK